MCATLLRLVVGFSSSSIACFKFPKTSLATLLHLADRLGDHIMPGGVIPPYCVPRKNVPVRAKFSLGKKVCFQKPRRRVFRPLNLRSVLGVHFECVLHTFAITKLVLPSLSFLALRGCISTYICTYQFIPSSQDFYTFT